MALPASSLFLSVGVGALILWRIYSRVRRMIGRQKFSNVRPWFTVVLFPSLLIFLLMGSATHPSSALALLAGVGVGTGLGVYGIRLTVFECTPTGRYYTPNAHLGIALSLILLARIGYRFIQQYGLAATTVATPDEFLRSPITLLIFGTLAGYYVTYAIGLLRWRRSRVDAISQA